MKLNYILSTLLFVLILSPSFGQSAGKGRAEKVKVLSYNIHHANPPSKQEGFIDLPAIAKVINDSKAQLVALQEVDVNTERSGKGNHQARELAKLTGMHYFFVKAIDHQGGDYGIAVLSKFPVIDSLAMALPLPAGAKGEPRALAAVKVKLSRKKSVWFASTHLDLKTETRLFQSDLIVKKFSTIKEPVILAGDFNATPDSPEIAFLDKSFTRTCIADCAPTIPVINPRKTIDFIMYTQKERIQTISTEVINETYASDHLPVAAELSIR